ncbi:hypothetical protein [Streptomyces naphthomycinicus]|uniref:hypothetical protein n=1 Tax=Streptomyces naphthomycinicus TaxID=2872625 RepID=UPI001CEC4A07|nr:hypothetical protein [Streptomyces sp. TML10]
MSAPPPPHPWSEDAVNTHLHEPSVFYTDREGSLAQVGRAIDARMAEIYRSLPGERLSFVVSLAGTVAATVWLALAGTLWAIGPGVLTVGIVVVWITAGSSGRTPPPEPPPRPRLE